jgi:hypothetical protein
VEMMIRSSFPLWVGPVSKKKKKKMMMMMMMKETEE